MTTLTRKLMLVSALSFGLLAAPAAMADRNDDRRQDRGPRWSEPRQHDRDDHRRGNDRDHREHRRDAQRGRHDQRPPARLQHHRHWQGPRYHAPRYQAPRGYVRHHWRAGHRVPATYRHSRYVVNDYRHYHLHQPPRGHHWVRVDNDVVLTAVATGVVAAVVYGLFR